MIFPTKLPFFDGSVSDFFNILLKSPSESEMFSDDLPLPSGYLT